MRSRYENKSTLIGNGKWEIGNSLMGNRKSLKIPISHSQFSVLDYAMKTRTNE